MRDIAAKLCPTNLPPKSRVSFDLSRVIFDSVTRDFGRYQVWSLTVSDLPFTLTDSMPVARDASVLYIWLLPMT